MQNSLIKIHRTNSKQYNPSAEQDKKKDKLRDKQRKERREQKRNVE